MWQEPDLADVDVPGVSIIRGHDDVLWVLRGKAGDQPRVEEAHLAAPEDTDSGPHGQLGHRGGSETKISFKLHVVFNSFVVCPKMALNKIVYQYISQCFKV